MVPRVMIIEDDDGVRAMLRLALEGEGYVVIEAPNGEEALLAFSEAEPDLMVVDLMLGGLSGIDAIRTIRRVSDIPIVIVSARDDTSDIVTGLEAGADDYVSKPFQLEEITARLRALLRRTHWTSDDGSAERGGPPRDDHADDLADVVLDSLAAQGLLVLQPAAGRLLRGGEPVHLTLTEFRLLCELTDAHGRVLSRAQLLENVWEHGYFGDERLVDVHVRRLRTKIEEDPAEPVLLITVRGLGYRLDRR